MIPLPLTLISASLITAAVVGSNITFSDDLNKLKAAEDYRARACFKYGFQYGRVVSLSRQAHVPEPKISAPGPCSLTQREADAMRNAP